MKTFRCWVLLAFAGVFAFPLTVHGQGLLGSKKEKRVYCDLTIHRGDPFWLNDGTLHDFLQKYFIPRGPYRIHGSTSVSSKHVDVILGFCDNSYQYVGNTPIFTQEGEIATLGQEWLGVDAVLDSIVEKLIHQALWPEAEEDWIAAEMERLLGPIEITFSATPLVSSEEMKSGIAKGISYEGELKSYHSEKDTLRIPMVLEGKDIVVSVLPGEQLNNLSLTSLKLFAMKEKLRHDLKEKFGASYNVPTPTKLAIGSQDIALLNPTIKATNPHQEAFLEIEIKIRFSREPVPSSTD